MPNDLALVYRAKVGDEEAMLELLRRYQSPIRVASRNLLGSAEDRYAEARAIFIELVLSTDDADTTTRRLTSGFDAACRRCRRSQLQLRHPEPERLLAPGPGVASEAERATAERAMSVLSEGEVAVVRLAYGFDLRGPMSDQEVADALSISRLKAHRLRRGALSKMRAVLGVLQDAGDRSA